ncbi:hypothetical protein VIN01S_30700 [Vibrio inusitatus NBRC 102082]|uniref:Ribosomal subunit interface protein n=1 Tax=Vibrio inusitatus NBRC 102082 TaxID=1219070 RepID=A0A4Y3HYR1_9VIBR|nr:ribosome-associated translation inhibitor RaiA [Vibrio inusitatus]GEA52266.1 hypothetical protein VIN01S_30700 [Vibrio inusitatus NBRC 102082]
MNISFNTRHITLSDAMKDHCEHDIHRLSHHHPRISEVSISIIYHESYKQFDIEVKAHLDHKWYFVKFEGTDFNLTVSKAVQGLHHELNKTKTKEKKEFHDHTLNRNLTSEEE